MVVTDLGKRFLISQNTALPLKKVSFLYFILNVNHTHSLLRTLQKKVLENNKERKNATVHKSMFSGMFLTTEPGPAWLSGKVFDS